MKLFGVDVSASGLMDVVSQRLKDRGLADDAQAPHAPDVEPRVDPLSFLVQALSSHVDPTQGLPVETHRDGPVGFVVVAGKRLFRRAAQGLINETLGRQRVFNGHVRDGYAQLAAEVIALRRRVKELEGLADGAPPPVPASMASSIGAAAVAAVRLSSARPTAPMPRASRAPMPPPITAPMPPPPTPRARPSHDDAAPAPVPQRQPSSDATVEVPILDLSVGRPPRAKSPKKPAAAKKPRSAPTSKPPSRAAPRKPRKRP